MSSTQAFALLIVASLLDTQPAVSQQTVTQRATTDFQGVGQVRVEAIEPVGKLPKLRISETRSGRLLFSTSVGTSSPNFYVIPAEKWATNPRLRFKVLDGMFPHSPIILAVAMSPGGSDCKYEGIVIGTVKGKLSVLTPKPVETLAEGGIYLGDLGSSQGYGLAVWDFIWGPNESHLDSHRYKVALYRYDRVHSKFVLFKTVESKEKHSSDDEALSELGLPYSNLLSNFPDFGC
jgi:hypothetical protein